MTKLCQNQTSSEKTYIANAALGGRGINSLVDYFKMIGALGPA